MEYSCFNTTDHSEKAEYKADTESVVAERQSVWCCVQTDSSDMSGLSYLLKAWSSCETMEDRLCK